MLTFLIMAGGSGERFWPLSTKHKPKQFLKIFNEKSLIRLTYERVLPLVEKNQIFIATNEIQLSALKDDLHEVEDSRIIIEPAFRDTAAAIAYGSMIISKYYANPTICVLASDHLISEEEEFRNVIRLAEQEAQKKAIVTLGIKPTYPETGYGYIQVEQSNLNQPTPSLGFKEKPALDTAKTYLASGNYLWNSGMFIFDYSTLLDALKKHSPNHYTILMKVTQMIHRNQGISTAHLVKDEFQNFEKKSIDFAVMEYADNIIVIPSNFGWNDVGNFLAFEELCTKDDNENIIQHVKCICVDSKNNIVVSDQTKQRVSLVGVENMIIVLHDTEILICAKERNQDIKKLLKLL